LADRFAADLVYAFYNEGAAVKILEDTHRMAESNRAFAHFARG
jgi:small subunit ribosomal protein S7